jgi:hypothetical protein
MFYWVCMLRYPVADYSPSATIRNIRNRCAKFELTLSPRVATEEAETLYRRERSWSDVTEEDLEDPETGRIFGVRYVDRVTREEVNLAADDGPSPCRDCNYVRILGWGRECEMCVEDERRARLLGAALASEVW